VTVITSLDQYPPILAALQDLKEQERIAHLRNLCRTDLYFLLRYGCNRKDLENEWLFQRCREVQASPDGHLDLWAREHYKSTIITFGMTIFDILRDPEATIGIFSHTRPIAKGFLRHIKIELESNENLKAWFPDILWSNPAKESPKWSEDDGLIVRRQTNPKESSIESWGLVDSQPTGKHFKTRCYDDIVVPGSVGSPEMIGKTSEALALSDNLGTIGGAARFVGTRYHFLDSYSDMLTRKIVKPRIYPATKDGTDDFSPENCVLMSSEVLAQKRLTQGMYVFACQMLLNPKGDEAQGFRREWLVFASGQPSRADLNVYIVCDPANEKRKRSDYTVFWVIGLGRDERYVILDLLRDKLNLGERADRLFELVEKWRPICVGYEQYGLMADIQHIKYLQEERNYRFAIRPLGGSMGKVDRIRRLMPLFEEGKIILPHTRMRTLYDRSTVNLIDAFVEEEFCAFPVASHDDMLDCLARILDPELRTRFPVSPDNFEEVKVIANPLFREDRQPQQPQRRWR
jgi:predicted phage terminase large subunit-like protein